jgi:hypothetical protein
LGTVKTVHSALRLLSLMGHKLHFERIVYTRITANANGEEGVAEEA